MLYEEVTEGLLCLCDDCRILHHVLPMAECVNAVTGWMKILNMQLEQD